MSRAVGERQLRGTLAAAALCFFALQVNFFALNLALSDIAADLDTTVTSLQWVLSGYMISVACTFIATGRLGDILGRRLMLLIGVAVFGLASLIGGAAPNETVLILARLLQGVGAAAMFTVGIASVTNTFPRARLQAAIGIVFAAGGLGSALGPVLGGVLTEFTTWRMVLWVNVPIAVAILLLTWTSVPESRDETAPRRIDVAGLALITGGLLLAIFGIDSAQDDGWASAVVIVPLAVGVLAVVAFVLVEARVGHPLIDLSLFRNRPFVVVSAAGGLASVPWTATIFLGALLLQDGRGLSSGAAGAALLPFSAAAAISGYYAGRLERFLPQWIFAAALILGGAGVVVLGLTSQWTPFLIGLFVAGLGLGLGFAYTSVGTQAVVRPQRAGAASGVSMTILVTTGAIAVAVASTLLARGTGGAPGVSPDTGEVIDALLIGVGTFSIAAGVLVPFVGRVTRDQMVGEFADDGAAPDPLAAPERAT